MPTSLEETLRSLRAASEPSRLRLLAVCAQGELTVSELCRVLEQSQPRVSRHLKLLGDAGLLIRFREEHWVYYRVPTDGPGAEAAKQILAWLDPEDAVLQRDRVRASRVRTARVEVPSAPEPGTLREALLREVGGEPLGDLLDVGTGSGRILQWLAKDAQHAVGVDVSTDALRVARTVVHGSGLSHCVLKQADMYELPFAAASFDTVTMEQLLSDASRPVAALAEAARILRPHGRVLIIDDYDRLESTPAGGRANPLATLRGWFAETGFDCERLRPVESGTGHLLLAVGRRRSSVPVAA